MHVSNILSMNQIKIQYRGCLWTMWFILKTYKTVLFFYHSKLDREGIPTVERYHLKNKCLNIIPQKWKRELWFQGKSGFLCLKLESLINQNRHVIEYDHRYVKIIHFRCPVLKHLFLLPPESGSWPPDQRWVVLRKLANLIWTPLFYVQNSEISKILEI